jgi:hypothetical protein
MAAIALLAIPAQARDSTLHPKQHAAASIIDTAPSPSFEPTPRGNDDTAPASSLIVQRLDALVERGRHWRIETERGPVHVWIPEGYDAATAATVVFVHGYHVAVDQAWSEYRLPQQFALSGINAMFVAPAAPDGKNASVVWKSLFALVAAVKANVDVAMPSQRLVAVGHSGAYRTLASWVANPQLDTMVLLDAVYAEYSFISWFRASPDRRLINIAYETTVWSDYMHRWLPTERVEGLPLYGFPHARVVYATTDIGHWELVLDGVALPLALRSIGVAAANEVAAVLPLGLPPNERVASDATLEVDSTGTILE